MWLKLVSFSFCQKSIFYYSNLLKKEKKKKRKQYVQHLLPLLLLPVSLYHGTLVGSFVRSPSSFDSVFFVTGYGAPTVTDLHVIISSFFFFFFFFLTAAAVCLSVSFYKLSYAPPFALLRCGSYGSTSSACRRTQRPVHTTAAVSSLLLRLLRRSLPNDCVFRCRPITPTVDHSPDSSPVLIISFPIWHFVSVF